jgi:hypothetical protein
MPEMKDLIYHGVRSQIKRVLEAMGEERILNGITAFETGASNWSACFFARAYPEVRLTIGNPEERIAELLGMPGNKVPMRIVYRTFDGINITMTRQGLLDFCRGFLDEKRDPDVQKAIDSVLNSVNYEGAEEKPIDFTVCAVTQQMTEPWESREWTPEKEG